MRSSNFYGKGREGRNETHLTLVCQVLDFFRAYDKEPFIAILRNPPRIYLLDRSWMKRQWARREGTGADKPGKNFFADHHQRVEKISSPHPKGHTLTPAT